MKTKYPIREYILPLALLLGICFLLSYIICTLTHEEAIILETALYLYGCGLFLLWLYDKLEKQFGM